MDGDSAGKGGNMSEDRDQELEPGVVGLAIAYALAVLILIVVLAR